MLIITGKIERVGGDELFQSITKNERNTGPFRRRVKLPTAQFEVEEITARMEEGILRIEVPKMNDSFVEVKKVDIK